MKNYFFIVGMIAAVFAGCSQEQDARSIDTDLIYNPATAAGEVDSAQAARMQFDADSYNFGKVSMGEKVSHTYRFTNVGNSDLIITSARGSCGCTVPTYPKQPIKPGESGEIEVTFDSEGRGGINRKTVSIVANTYPATTVLHLEGEVLVPSKELDQ